MTRAALRLSEDRHDGVPVLIISGELDPFGAASLLTWARGFADGPDRATVWDISGLRHPDGHHLLTAFPAAQRLVGPWPRRSIHLTGAAPAVVNSLGRLRVDRFMPVHPDLTSALTQAANEAGAVHRQTTLPARPDSSATARACVDDLLADLDADVRDVARLVTSELAANAVRHAPGAAALTLALTSRELLVALTDRSRQVPILRPVQATATQGRGIQLVAALSESWGVRLVQRRGKTVWARIPTHA